MKKLEKLAKLAIIMSSTAGLLSLASLAAADSNDDHATISVTASAPYIVNIEDYAADFTIDDYTSMDAKADAWNIWTNAPGSITVTVATNQADAKHAYMQHTSLNSMDGQSKVPFDILYQPCGDTGTPIDITPKGGQTSFTLPHEKANQKICSTNPGVSVIKRPAMTDMGPPLAGSYTSTVSVTIQEPSGN